MISKEHSNTLRQTDHSKKHSDSINDGSDEEDEEENKQTTILSVKLPLKRSNSFDDGNSNVDGHLMLKDPQLLTVFG